MLKSPHSIIVITALGKDNMKKLILIVILFIISNNLSAIGDSNIGSYYRPHTCVAPIEPIDFNEAMTY